KLGARLDLNTSACLERGVKVLPEEKPMTRNNCPVRSAPLTRAASALARHPRSLSIGVPGCALILAACFALVGCDEPAKEAPSKAAAEVTATAPPAVTTAAAVKEEPKEENPAESIECADGPNADFHDSVLEQEVRRKLEKEEGDIPVKLRAQVKSVNLKRDPKATTDYLDPCIFPHLTNVKDLFLARGKLRDISLLG